MYYDCNKFELCWCVQQLTYVRSEFFVWDLPTKAGYFCGGIFRTFLFFGIKESIRKVVVDGSCVHRFSDLKFTLKCKLVSIGELPKFLRCTLSCHKLQKRGTVLDRSSCIWAAETRSPNGAHTCKHTQKCGKPHFFVSKMRVRARGAS